MVSPRSFNSYALFALAFFAKSGVHAFSANTNDNLAVYWGQDASGSQKDLSYYCDDDTIDAIPIAFLYEFFGTGGEPVIDVSNICGSGGANIFPGTDLLDCSFLASDIKTCQAKGKIVTISLGGATGAVGFTSSGQAQSFAKTIWNMFLGGSGDMRPFGDAVLDGVDLDIEGGSPSFYSDFVNEIRSLSNSASKKYYVTAAPQCPYPDASIGEGLNGASFDAVYVQFYNNYCGLDAPSEFNFATWDKWAKETSPNPDVKVYIGAPGSSDAAGTGYVDASTLAGYVKEAQEKYSSFGGVMLWDASVSYTQGGNSFAAQVKNAMVGSGGSSSATTSKVITSSASTTSETHSLPPISVPSISVSIPITVSTPAGPKSSHTSHKAKGTSSSPLEVHSESSTESKSEAHSVTSSPEKATSTSSWTDTWWTPTQTVWWTPTQTVWWTPTQTVWWTPTQTVWWTPSARAEGGAGSKLARAVRSAAPEPAPAPVPAPVAEEARVVFQRVAEPEPVSVPELEGDDVPLNDTPRARHARRHVHPRFAVNRESH